MHEVESGSQLRDDIFGVRLAHAQLWRDGVEQITQGRMLLGEHVGRPRLQQYQQQITDKEK